MNRAGRIARMRVPALLVALLLILMVCLPAAGAPAEHVCAGDGCLRCLCGRLWELLAVLPSAVAWLGAQPPTRCDGSTLVARLELQPLSPVCLKVKLTD